MLMFTSHCEHADAHNLALLIFCEIFMRKLIFAACCEQLKIFFSFNIVN